MAASDGLGARASLPPAGATVLPVAIVVVVGFVILVAVLLHTGVFDKHTSASTAQIVAAMLTLLGALMASAFTLVGVLLKHSIDRHSARLADDAENSRRLEAEAAEARLRLDTSIKAVELLTMPDGQPAPSARQAGALFVLGSPPLEQLDLAVALLNESWDAGKISASAAVWVIDRALRQANTQLQYEAATTLFEHAKLLPNTDGSDLAWPRCATLAWPMHVDYFARSQLLAACAAGIAARSPQDWRRGTVSWFILVLDQARKTDTAPDLKSGATLVLDAILAWHMRRNGATSLLLPEGTLDLESLRSELAPTIDTALTQVSQEMLNWVEKLRVGWGWGDKELSHPDASEQLSP